MNIFADFSHRIKKALQSLQLRAQDGGALDFSRIAVEPPRDASHGDLACNAAMVLAKPLGLNPRAVAEKLAEALRSDKDIESLEIAGPGFINLRLAPIFWQRHLADILGEGASYGKSATGAGKKINVEYVSANPTGPMHVGHCRGAVFGDALANLLTAAGYDVTKEYYINDAGAQIDVLARSVMLRYREALGDDIGEIPAGLYPGDYLVPLGKSLAAEFGRSLNQKPENEALDIVRGRYATTILEECLSDMAGDTAIADWNAGFRFGARVARDEGYRRRAVVPTADSLGFPLESEVPVELEEAMFQTMRMARSGLPTLIPQSEGLPPQEELPTPAEPTQPIILARGRELFGRSTVIEGSVYHILPTNGQAHLFNRQQGIYARLAAICSRNG